MPIAPERRQARTLEGDPRAPRAARRAPSGRARSSRTSTVRTRRRGRSSPSWPAIARDQRLAIIGTHQPDVVTRDDPWAETSPRSPPRRGRAERLDPAAARSRRAGRPDRGDRGRAGLGQPPAARRRALRRHPARGRGAAGGPAGAAARVADRFVRGPRHRPARRPLPGMPARPAARWRRPAARSRPAQLAGAAAAFEAESDQARAALGRADRARATACSTRTCWPAGPRRSSTASSVERGGAHRVPPRVDRAGGRARPAADARGPATTPRSPRGLVGPPVALARHWLAAHDPRSARTAAIEAAGVAAERHAAADELAALELALAIPEDPRHGRRPAVGGPAGLGPRRAAGPGLRGGLRDRPDHRATAFLEVGHRRPGQPRRDRVRLGLLHERLASIRRAAGDPAGAMSAARRAVELVPREPTPARATRPRRAGPADDARRDLLRRAAPGPRGDRRRPGLRAGRPASRRSTP